MGGGRTWGSRCLHLPGVGGASGEASRALGSCPCVGQVPSSAPWGGAGREHRRCQAGARGATALGWQPPSHPIPARALWMLREGGSCPGPRAVLRSLGVSLAEAPAAGWRLHQRAGSGAPALQPLERWGTMASRCSCSPAEGPAVPWSAAAVARGALSRLCQDFGGSTKPSEIVSPQQGGSLRAAIHHAAIHALRGQGWAVKGEDPGSLSAAGQR